MYIGIYMYIYIYIYSFIHLHVHVHIRIHIHIVYLFIYIYIHTHNDYYMHARIFFWSIRAIVAYMTRTMPGKTNGIDTCAGFQNKKHGLWRYKANNCRSYALDITNPQQTINIFQEPNNKRPSKVSKSHRYLCVFDAVHRGYDQRQRYAFLVKAGMARPLAPCSVRARVA